MKNMVASLVVVGAFAFWLGGVAQADTDIGDKNLIGVGIGGGTLTYGLSGKYHLSKESAVIASVGANYGFSFDVGYLHQVMTLWDGGDSGEIDLAVGGAAMLWLYDVGFGSSMILGGRGIVEFAYKFASMPLEVTAEWGPSFLTGSGTFGGLYLAGGGGAVRWFF